MNQFATKEQEFKYFKDNKNLLILNKKSAIKKSDGISYCNVSYSHDDFAIKSIDSNQNISDENSLKRKVVINTTGIFDSHRDVHIPGCYKRSYNNSGGKSLFLQEHELCFENVIDDKAVPSIKKMKWSQLGLNYDGTCEALIFDANISNERNPFMFNQYKNNWVNQHSIGMQYVTLFLCINSSDRYYIEEKENWDKYIDYVANKQDAIDSGIFWAVTELKIIEGSAVVLGSNFATPDITENKNIDSPEGTQIYTDDTRESTIKEIKELFKTILTI